MCCWRASSHCFFGFLKKEDHAVHAMNEVFAIMLRTTHSKAPFDRPSIAESGLSAPSIFHQLCSPFIPRFHSPLPPIPCVQPSVPVPTHLSHSTARSQMRVPGCTPYISHNNTHTHIPPPHPYHFFSKTPSQRTSATRAGGAARSAAARP